MKLKTHHLVIALALLAGIHCAVAQGTMFTYQGRLNDAGSPANGTNYGMVFYLYDAPTNGNLLGNEGIVSVTASNGLFTVPLDFGNVFDGNPRWLEISVQKNGGTFTTLSPRQQIQPAPYAVFANTASNVSGTISPGQLSGSLSLAQLPGGIVTNNESSVNLNGSFTGNGGTLTNLQLSSVGPQGTFSLLSVPPYFNQTKYPGGFSPLSVAVADFNGDGKPDLVCANFNNLMVLTNNGSGGFGLYATITDNGMSPAFVTTEDIDRDGRADLIVLFQNSPIVSVQTNNGNGGFGKYGGSDYRVDGSFPVRGSLPHCVVAADVDGDGLPDLITANWNNSVTVLKNYGVGGFDYGGATYYGASFNVGSNADWIVARDVNGDSRMDLITANWSDNTLTILTNNGGGFTLPNMANNFGLYATLPVGVNPSCIAAADVNGDGHLDLISANFGDNTLTILTNNGSGIFGSNATLNVGSGPAGVVAADVNGDGHLDLACVNANDNSLTVLTNDGTGVFHLDTTVYPGGDPVAIAAADFDGDGNTDLVSADRYDRTLTVLSARTQILSSDDGFNSPAGLTVGGNISAGGIFTGNGSGLTNLNYNNLINRPVIPSTNGFVTASITNGLATTNFVTSRGYLTNTATAGNYVFAYDTNSEAGYIFFQGAVFANLVQMNGWTYSVVNDAGDFTCPQTGLYMIQYSGEATGGAGDTFSMAVIVNNGIAPGSQASVYFPTATGSHPVSVSKSCIVSLNAGDILKLETSGTSPTSHLAPDASVSGSVTPSVSLTIVRIQ